MEKAAKQSPVPEPLLLMTDQEGGEVRRLPGAPLRSEKEIGESSHRLTLARQAGIGAGDNLRGVGMNVNLAPVVDVYRHPGDFTDQYQRSYSSNPATVGTLDHAFIYAQQSTGVAATAKHFPGLGAATASENTDERPVTLGCRCPPCARSTRCPIQGDRDRHEVGHGLLGDLSGTGPEPPCRPVVEVVRASCAGGLSFRGVTITDALKAGGCTPSAPTGTAR